MKTFATLTAALLFLFAMASTPAFSQDRDDRPAQAQDDKAKDKDRGAAKKDDKAMKQGDERPGQDQRRREDSRPESGRNENARPDVDRNNNSRPAAARPQEENRQEQRPDQHADRDRQQQRPDQHADRDRQQHPVQARGKRIPDERFRSNFGHEHHFHVDRTRVVNVSQPVVVYGGYQFQLAEPWPAEWSYDDDCYIDYVDDGYYLFDDEHPGIRIAVYVNE
jgi:hypothetical protein